MHKKVFQNLPEDRAECLGPIFKEQMRSKESKGGEIILTDEAADAFDVFLDYLYCKNHREVEKLLKNSENGLALYGFAEHFQIDGLQRLLSDFYRNSTSPENDTLDFINESSNRLLSGGVLDAGLEKFACTLHTMEDIDVKELEPEFLLQALKKRKSMSLTCNRLDSENISCLVALCTLHYKSQLSRKFFYELTHAEYIPFIDQEAALQLLTIETEQKYWEDTDNFSGLQVRCVQSLLKDWKGLRAKFESDTAFWKVLRSIDSGPVLSFLLMHATRMKDASSTME